VIDYIGLEYYLLIGLIIVGCGYAQGHLTGSAIRDRIHVGRNFVRIISIPLAALFFLQAFIKIHGMSNIANSPFAQTVAIHDISELSNFVQSFLPNDTFESILFAVPIVLFLLTFVAGASGKSKVFIRTISLIAVGFMFSIKYLGLEVDDDVMTWFVLYQLAIPTGILISTRALKNIQRLSSRIHFLKFP